MRSEQVQAFVISTRDYGDNDRIVSLFTLEHGRVSAFARRARSSRTRFGAALEALARIDCQIRLKQGLAGLAQADLRSIYPAIRGDLARIAHALYACELIEALTPEGVPLPRLFRLLAAYFDRLEAAGAAEAERRFFEINLLNILGYRPSLMTCSRCGEPFPGQGALLQGGGEPVCGTCASTGTKIGIDTLAELQKCLATGSFERSGLHSTLIASEAAALLDQAIVSHAGRSLRSLEFLRQVTAV